MFPEVFIGANAGLMPLHMIIIYISELLLVTTCTFLHSSFDMSPCWKNDNYCVRLALEDGVPKSLIQPSLTSAIMTNLVINNHCDLPGLPLACLWHYLPVEKLVAACWFIFIARCYHCQVVEGASFPMKFLLIQASFTYSFKTQ